jgi:ABC-type iron transport system FetAB ATPase subunit
VIVSGLLVVASLLAASGRDAAASEAVRLTVPYVRQTKALCGGAAAAMVFRYWGDGQADPNEFAPLLDRAAGGLATGVLAKAIEDRGWRASASPDRSRAWRISCATGGP